MTLAILCGSIIKTSALTILGSMSMRAIEQKDYEKLIKFTGVSQISIDVITYLKFLEEHPPKACIWIDKTFKTIEYIYDKINIFD